MLKRTVAECRRDLLNLFSRGHIVYLVGAEVLTDLAYLETYRLARQRWVATNGLLLASDSGICQKLLTAGVKKARISWHIGFQHLLNDIPDDVIQRAIRNALEAGMEVEVFCVIGNPNFNLLADEIAPKVLDVGVGSLRLFQLMPMRPKMKQYQLTTSQKLSVFEQADWLSRCYADKGFEIIVDENFGPNERIEKDRLAFARGEFCLAGKYYFVIDTDNKVYPCTFLSSPRFQIGVWENGQIKITRPFFHDGCVCAAEKELVTNTPVGVV